MKSFKRHISIFEKAALIIILMLVVVAFVAQIFYGGGAMNFFVASLVCAVILMYLILFPSRYDFEEDALVLVNPKIIGDKRILYSDILHYDTVGSFLAAKIDFDAIEVVITYKSNGTKFKKSVNCHPKDIQGFVSELQRVCPKYE